DLHQQQLALQTLDTIRNSAQPDPNTILQVAQQFAALGDYPRLEATLQKLVELVPQSAESWYDLAALKSILGKSAESLQALRRALTLGAERRLHDPQARDLLAEVQQDPRFVAIRSLPEFK